MDLLVDLLASLLPLAVSRAGEEIRDVVPADDQFADRLGELAQRLDRDYPEVRAEAASYLREMGATQGERATEAWSRFSNWMYRAHELVVDEEKARRLRALDRKHSLAFLFSHRSYLDGMAP